MESSKSILGRPSKHSKLVNGLKQYLLDARLNPTLKLNILAVSRAIGVKKSTIYLHSQHDPEVAQLLNNIRDLARARKLVVFDGDATANREPEEYDETGEVIGSEVARDATESISLEMMATHSARAVQVAVWNMSRFIGRHRKHQYVSDLPRVVFDLDSTLAQLHRIREELGGLSDEWIKISRTDCEVADIVGQLSLSYTSEEQL